MKFTIYSAVVWVDRMYFFYNFVEALLIKHDDLHEKCSAGFTLMRDGTLPPGNARLRLSTCTIESVTAHLKKLLGLAPGLQVGGFKNCLQLGLFLKKE